MGGLEEGVHGRQRERKALIVVAGQEDGRGLGRIRMRRVPDASAESLVPLVEASVERGSVVPTDGGWGYEPLEGKGYRHPVSCLKGHKKSPSELLPRVPRVLSRLPRWRLGTQQGAVSLEHLDSYLDEFTFRFHRRTSPSRGQLFYRLVQPAVAVEPSTDKSMLRAAPASRS